MIYSPIGKSFDLNPFYTGNIEVNLSNPSERCVGYIDIQFEPSGKFKVNTRILKDSVSTKQKLKTVKINASKGNISVTSFSKNINIPNIENIFNLNLHIEQFEFKQNLDTEIKYWVLPLTNLITDFKQYDPGLDYLSQTENINAKFYPHRLINFKLRNNQSWIEPLRDYQERKEKLISGEVSCTITSIMVCEICSIIDNNDIIQNVCFDLLHVLGLATGNQIQAPWIEFRDANYELIKRIHWNIQPIQYTKGNLVIKGDDIKQNSGIGHLLEKSLSSGILDKPHLKVSLIYAIVGGNINQYLEIRKGNFIVALETLAKYYRCNSQNLTEGLEDIQIHKINNYLKNAATQIKNLANDPTSAVDGNQIKIINKISSRTQTTPIGKAKDFGLQVVQLLKHFNLLDCDVIENHYRHNPRSDGRDFAGVLSYYRGAIIHEGYFNFDSGDYDFEDVVRVLKHLHDILIRLNLIMLEYRGHYMTPISNSSKPVHWVNVSTLASDLGYK